MMGDAAGESPSLIVVVHNPLSDHFCSIVQIDTLLDLDLKPGTVIKNVAARYLAHFKYPRYLSIPTLNWLFVPPPSSTNDLYILPSNRDTPMYGPTFNPTTRMCKPFALPISPVSNQTVVNVGQHIYFMEHPYRVYAKNRFLKQHESGFYRYTPAEDKWVDEVPFPDQSARKLADDANIVASAVWDDIIIFNVGGFQIWAYHVNKRKWYPVHVVAGDVKIDGKGDGFKDVVHDKMYYIEHDYYGKKDAVMYEINGSEGDHFVDGNYSMEEEEEDDDRESKKIDLCCTIIGQGFVVKNTIYALSSASRSSVLALSLEKKETPGGELKISCSLLSEMVLPCLDEISGMDACFRTRHFVHLGGDNFCLVQSCQFSRMRVRYQPIQVTYMKLKGQDKMVVTSICSHKLPSNRQFRIGLCFSKPEFKSMDLKQGKTTFEFDPFHGIVTGQKATTYFNPTRLREAGFGKQVQEEENVEATSELSLTTAEAEGYCMTVTMPPGVTMEKLLRGMVFFGPIKAYTKHETEDGCFVKVLFASAAAKADALEPSDPSTSEFSNYLDE